MHIIPLTTEIKLLRSSLMVSGKQSVHLEYVVCSPVISVQYLNTVKGPGNHLKIYLESFILVTVFMKPSNKISHILNSQMKNLF